MFEHEIIILVHRIHQGSAVRRIEAIPSVEIDLQDSVDKTPPWKMIWTAAASLLLPYEVSCTQTMKCDNHAGFSFRSIVQVKV